MILVFVIILFIILLLYKCRLFTREKYTINSLGIDWTNKAGVSGMVTKWIMVLHDKNGNKIHETEDDSSQNLQNFVDVSLEAIKDKKFDSSIIGTNTLSVYYNDKLPSTKVYSKDISFAKDDFSASLSDITENENNKPEAFDTMLAGTRKNALKSILKTNDKDEILQIYAYPNGSTDDLYKYINPNVCNIYDFKASRRYPCFIHELEFEKTGDEDGYFYPNFPSLGSSDNYFGVNSSKEVTMTSKDASHHVRQKFYL